MAATLTWHVSANGTKTNTTVASFFTDLNTLVTSNAGNADYKWQVASVNDASTPYYLVLKRKDASAGRILVVCWTSAPAANNVAILDGNPTTNNIYIAWFPSGSADTPSNLTAASGTILGDDTSAVKCVCMGAVSSIYSAGYTQFYADCEDGVIVLVGNTSNANMFGCGAGKLVVDLVDQEYDCAWGSSTTLSQFSANSGNPFTWTLNAVTGGSTTAQIRTNYGTANTPYFVAFMPTGNWAATAVGLTDVLSNTAVNKAWFVPVLLVGQGKGGGFPIKFRQMGFGPASTLAKQSYNSTGPVTAAVQLSFFPTGGVSFPWVTNFEI